VLAYAALLMLPTKLPIKLLAETLPVTDKLERFPTLVMLGCAFVVTVPATVAMFAVLAANA
jgi:hypothetical protein